MISRRGLFGLFGGVAAAPLVKALPADAVSEPMPEAGWPKVITYRGYLDRHVSENIRLWNDNDEEA